MVNAPSRFSTFGWWLAWIYLLSLTGLFFLPPVLPPVDLPAIAFVERGITVTEEDGTVKEEVTATILLSKKPDKAINVTVEYRDNTAIHGRDFEAVRPTARTVRFDAGDQEETISFGRRGRDVEIVGPTQPPKGGVPGTVESRSFTVRLKNHPDLQEVGDPGSLAVTILRAERMQRDQARAAFEVTQVDAAERELPTLPIAVTLDKALPEDATIKVTLFRTQDGERTEVATIDQNLKADTRRFDLVIAEAFPAEALRDHHVLDDAFPEPDESYELEMMSSHVYPGDPLALTARNDDGIIQNVSVTSTDDGTGLIVADGVGCNGTFTRRRYIIEATLPDGTRRELGPVCPCEGPLEIPKELVKQYDRRMIDIAVRPYTGTGDASGAGSGDDNGQDSDGSGSGGRTGNGGGTCFPKGQGDGPCGGGKCLVGPPVPGDYMLIVVNNERLHEPGAAIVEKVREALADESAKPYDNGAIIINPEGEEMMTATGGGPKKDKVFRPFERAEDDVAVQLKRIEEVIARKREAAQRRDLRAVVVWPERDLASGAGLAPVANPEMQPVSFLFPGADPSYARNMRPLVPPRTPPGAVTIRSTKEEELTDHLINVMQQAREPQPQAAPSPDSAPGKTPAPRDVEEALNRATG